jgi:hypothetical protein
MGLYEQLMTWEEYREASMYYNLPDKPSWIELFEMVLRAHQYVDDGVNMTLEQLGDLRSDIVRMEQYNKDLFKGAK